jgi:DNA-binding PadR family transcriptional regulator
MMDMSDMDISSPSPLHILLALLDGPTHGYGILQHVRARSDGRVRLGTGSLYRHLGRLIDAGLVAEAEPPAGDDARRSAYYRLSPRGRAALAAERDRLAALVSALDGLRGASRKGRA